MAKFLDLTGLTYLWNKVKTYVSETTISKDEKGAADGVATLTSGGKLSDSQIPDYVDTILEYQNPILAPEDPEVQDQSTQSAEYIVYFSSINKFCAYSGSKYYGNWTANDKVAAPTKYGTYEGINGYTPKEGVLYLNTSDLKHYKYSGSTLVEVYQGGGDIETISTGEIDNIFSE